MSKYNLYLKQACIQSIIEKLLPLYFYFDFSPSVQLMNKYMINK